MVVVSLDSELDGVMFYQVRGQKVFHRVQIVLARIKA